MATFDLGKVVGDKGAKGDKGDKGDTGSTGPAGNGISSIALVSTSGKVKTYRITYTNGDHFDFNVTDGNDGALDVQTSWGSTLSDTKVPSEKLTKNSLDNKSDINHTHSDYIKIFYDLGVTGYKNNNWFISNTNSFTVTTDTTGTLLEYNLLSGWASIYANATNSTSYPFPIGTSIEFDVVSCVNNVRFQLYDGVNNRYQITLPTEATNYHVKIVVGLSTITSTVNGETTTAQTSPYLTSDYQCNFASNTSSSSVKFKNFRISLDGVFSPNIVDNLTTNDSTQVLSAKQGYVLAGLIGNAITYINE